MTSKDILTGKITIHPEAVRGDLGVELIHAGPAAEMMFRDLGEAIRFLRRVGLHLPTLTDADAATLRTVCEAEEILINLRVRLDADEPTATAVTR